MSIHTWHLFGVAIPYVLIATALWGLSAGAVKDAVRVGLVPDRTGWGIPSVPLAYALGLVGVAFIYGCALDRTHMGAAIGMDPHAVAPGADAYLYGLAVASWLSASLLVVGYVWLRRGTQRICQVSAESERARQDAERQRVLLQTIIDAVPSTIYAKDADGVVLLQNATSAGPDGSGDLVGKTVFDIFPEAEANAHHAQDEAIKATGQGQTVEHPFVKANGDRRTYRTTKVPLRDIDGETIGVVGISHDVTEQKRVEAEVLKAKEAAEAREAEMAEQREILQSLFDAIPDAIFVADVDDRFVAANRGMLKYIGEDVRDQVIGRTRAEVLPPEVAEEYRGYDDLAIASGQRVHQMVNEYTTLDGDVITIETTRVVVRDEAGQAVRVVGVARDVTAQKRIETDLRAARDAAEAASVAKSEFLANMSHEIRTPMNGVIGMTSLLADTALDPEQADFVETIRMSGDVLLTIINDILDFSKIEAGQVDLEETPLDLREMIETALDLVAPSAAEKGVELAYSIEAGTPGRIVGDVTRIRQVVVNLLSNAIKFTDEGAVCVRVAADPAGTAVGTRTALRIAVEDTGVGIAPGKVDAIFESFSQADASTTRRFGGTGLGLAISRGLAETMGGTLTVESEVGVGSTFVLAIEAEVAGHERRVFLTREQPQLAGRHVLIVDDNAVNRQILTHLADGWGMSVVAVESGPDAVGAALAAEARGTPFDLVLLDMQMPNMNGIETAQQFGKTLQTSPLLVMLTSVNRDSSLRDLAAEAGIHSVLYKPAKPAALHETLVRAFGERTTASVSSPTPRETPGAAEAPAWIARPVEAPATPERSPLRVLVAEDNLINQKVVVRLLDRLGVTADVVADGAEAVTAIRDRAAAGRPFDVVFMDVQMPQMDGLEATRTVRAWDEAIRQPHIIALTANAMEGDRERCLVAGCDAYLKKPVRREDLAGALAEREAIPTGRA